MYSFVDCTSQNIIIQGDSGGRMTSVIVRKKVYERVSNSRQLPR